MIERHAINLNDVVNAEPHFIVTQLDPDELILTWLQKSMKRHDTASKVNAADVACLSMCKLGLHEMFNSCSMLESYSSLKSSMPQRERQISAYGLWWP